MAKQSKYIDEIVVSTDDPVMYGIAESYSVANRALRPSHLATSTASTIDVILHELQGIEENDVYVVLLQVTTPLRTTVDLDNFCEMLVEDNEAKSVVSLVEHDAPHPDKIQIVKDGKVKSYLNKESMVARQLLPEVYSLNGAFYLSLLSHLREQHSFFSSYTLPFVMPQEKSINLDNKYDLLLLEALIEKKLVRPEKFTVV